MHVLQSAVLRASIRVQPKDGQADCTTGSPLNQQIVRRRRDQLLPHGIKTLSPFQLGPWNQVPAPESSPLSEATGSLPEIFA